MEINRLRVSFTGYRLLIATVVVSILSLSAPRWCCTNGWFFVVIAVVFRCFFWVEIRKERCGSILWGSMIISSSPVWNYVTVVFLSSGRWTFPVPWVSLMHMNMWKKLRCRSLDFGLSIRQPSFQLRRERAFRRPDHVLEVVAEIVGKQYSSLAARSAVPTLLHMSDLDLHWRKLQGQATGKLFVLDFLQAHDIKALARY